jgi:hypothetical protein
MVSVGGGASLDDLDALPALANALAIVGSWSSYKMTPMGTIARLELSLANSSVISFFPRNTCKYSRPSKLFYNLQSS